MKEIKRRYEISDEEYSRIDHLLPNDERTGKKGRPPKPVRTKLNGLLWVARSGAPWRDMPERYGSWNTVYDYFKQCCESGIFEKIMAELSVDADMQDLSIDSSIKVHQHAAGAKKGLKTPKPINTSE